MREIPLVRIYWGLRNERPYREIRNVVPVPLRK